MIPVDNPNLYEASLRLLNEHTRTSGSYQGRLVQIFLAAKFAGDGVPVVGNGAGLPTGELQIALDDLYTKRSRLRAGAPSVASLFSNEHLYPTGVTGGSLTSPSNIWRNNFQLQKAMVCYASETELQDPAFVMAPRIACPHLRAVASAPVPRLAQASCVFKPGTRYRGEDRAKFMRRDPNTDVISVVNPSNFQLWQNAVVPIAGRLPIAALVCALYYDADLAGGRNVVKVTDFLLDFNFSLAEFHALFDDDPSSPPHIQLRAAFPGLIWDRIALPEAGRRVPPPAVRAVHPARPPSAVAVRRAPRRRIPLDQLSLVAPPVAPPKGSHWWAAEQAVQQVFREEGWDIIDRSRQGVGFDFEASRTGLTLYVEVKSSAGACSPVLTRREFEAAHDHRNRYVLALVENYDPTAMVHILWVRNPATLGMVARETLEYPLPRSLWLPQAEASLEV